MLVVHRHHLCNSMSLACWIRLEPHDQTESTTSGMQGVKRSSAKMEKFYIDSIVPMFVPSVLFCFGIQSKTTKNVRQQAKAEAC